MKALLCRKREKESLLRSDFVPRSRAVSTLHMCTIVKVLIWYSGPYWQLSHIEVQKSEITFHAIFQKLGNANLANANFSQNQKLHLGNDPLYTVLNWFQKHLRYANLKKLKNFVLILCRVLCFYQPYDTWFLRYTVFFLEPKTAWLKALQYIQIWTKVAVNLLWWCPNKQTYK